MTAQLSPTLEERGLDVLLLERLRERLELGRVRKAVVTLDITGADAWTLYIEGGRIHLGFGRASDPDATVVTDAGTMTELLEGSLSGIEAFVTHRLRVRGNLALTLRLSAGLARPDAPSSFPRARDVHSAGARTFLIEAGDGPPVLAFHGLGATNSSMLPTLFDMSRDHRVVTPDSPGFGDSAKPVRSYDAEYYGRWAIGLMDALGLDEAYLVGNSLGGRIALEAAMRAPERVRKLALFAPSPAFIRRREFARLVRLLRPEMALLPLPMAHRYVVRTIKAMFADPAVLPGPWYDAAADEFLRVFRKPAGRIAFFSAARQIYLEEPYGDTGFWDRLRALEVPSLFIWGDKDRLVPARFARHVQEALPHATSVVFENCGHVPQFELPERTHDLVRSFFSD